MNSKANREMRHEIKNKKLEGEKKSYYVYLLLCDDGSYYTG